MIKTWLKRNSYHKVLFCKEITEMQYKTAFIKQHVVICNKTYILIQANMEIKNRNNINKNAAKHSSSKQFF